MTSFATLRIIAPRKKERSKAVSECYRIQNPATQEAQNSNRTHWQYVHSDRPNELNERDSIGGFNELNERIHKE